MTRSLFVFFGTFLAGALIALAGRAALFKPHAAHENEAHVGGEYAAMVSNPLVPAAKPAATAPARASATPMEGPAPSGPGSELGKAGAGAQPVGPALAAVPGIENGAVMRNPDAPLALSEGSPVDSVVAGSAAPGSAARAGPTSGIRSVNTLCAICGMAVDPTLPTVEYEGKTIGFGCKLCPPKFKADPDRYGPLYLKNEVIKR